MPRSPRPPADHEIDHLLFDHISDAVFATDLNNHVTHWTPSAERLFGYTADEAIGSAFGDLLPFRMAHPEDEAAFFAELAAGRTWRGSGTVRLRDGREMWIASSVEPILEDGRVVGSVSVSRDIGEAVAALEAQAEQERFISAVLDVAGALVVVLDAHGRVVRFNRACERLTGISSAEIVGRAFWDIVIPAAEVDEIRRTFADISAGAFPQAHENHWQTRSGALPLIAWQNTCLTDAQGAVTHVIATGIDITEARRADVALRGIETVGRLLAEQGPVPSALDAVLGELEARMGYRLLALYLRDGRGLRLGAKRGFGAIPEHLDLGAGVIGRAYRTQRAEMVADVRADPDYVAGSSETVTEIAVPLIGEEETLGVLNLEATRAGDLAAADLRLATAVADRLSTALLLNTEQQALRERARLFASLSEFAAVTNAILEPGRLVTALVDAVGAVVESNTIVITTLDRTDGRYRVGAVRGLADEAVGAIIEPGDGNTGRAIAERRVVTSDADEDGGYTTSLRRHMRYDSIRGIAVPLIREDVVLGVISVGRAGSDATFTDAEREVIGLLGSQAALAVANAHLVQEVSALAVRDGLTGLFNRRHFDAALDLAIGRYKRRAPAGILAAIMFDLDHFGQLNRLHGHLLGDAMLRLFSGILKERFRSADLVARYGGEEFIAILEDCHLQEAVRIADGVRQELEARSVEDPEGKAIHATVSAGCAEIDPADPTREALIGRADVGLFMAKRAGRDRVVAAS